MDGSKRPITLLSSQDEESCPEFKSELERFMFLLRRENELFVGTEAGDTSPCLFSGSGIIQDCALGRKDTSHQSNEQKG